jgi:Domain of unknown function (DUF6468)
MPAGLILESLVAVLLVVSIGYCFTLNRRLAGLRHGQKELHLVVRALNDAAEKARFSMDQLRRNGLPVIEELGEKTRAARALADELGLIVESANNLADRLAGPLTGAAVQNHPAPRKPDPIEALARLDESFRRKIDRNAGPVRGPDAVKADLFPESKPEDGDLRTALRAMR